MRSLIIEKVKIKTMITFLSIKLAKFLKDKKDPGKGTETGFHIRYYLECKLAQLLCCPFLKVLLRYILHTAKFNLCTVQF